MMHIQMVYIEDNKKERIKEGKGRKENKKGARVERKRKGDQREIRVDNGNHGCLFDDDDPQR